MLSMTFALLAPCQVRFNKGPSKQHVRVRCGILGHPLHCSFAECVALHTLQRTWPRHQVRGPSVHRRMRCIEGLRCCAASRGPLLVLRASLRSAMSETRNVGLYVSPLSACSSTSNAQTNNGRGGSRPIPYSALQCAPGEVPPGVNPALS